MATAQYVVDIAANMASGDKTIAQLDELTRQLSGGGKNADFFSQAIVKVSADLASAKAASAAANASLAEGNIKFAELERAAVQAAKAEEKASLAGKLDPSISRSAFQAKAALDGYGLTLKSLEVNAAAASTKEEQLAKTLGNVKQLSGHVDKSLAGSAESTEKLRGALASVPGPAGKLGSSLLAPVQGFQKLSASMGASNAAMVIGAAAAAALVVAVLAVAAAAVYATVSVAAWAVGLSDVNRNAALSQQAVAALHPEIAALSSAYAAITDATGQGASALNDLEKQLKAAKVTAADMPGALRAAALAETALGKGGASEFVDKIKEGKVAVGALSAEFQSKLGGIVAKQMLGLDAQSARLKKSIGEIFGGLNIEGVLGGLQTLVDLFDKNTAAGQAMKFLFESVFQPIIDQAQSAAYFVEAFVLGFLIGMTKLYIGLKPTIKAVSEFLGFKDSSLTDGLDLAKKAGELIVPVVLGLVGAFAAVVAVIGIVVGVSLAWTAAIYGMIAAVVGAAVYIGVAFVNAFVAVWDYLSALPGKMLQLGTDLIMGLVNGIAGSANAVVEAVTGVVGGAIDAAKKKLGIASPSKVFAEIGGYTGEGLANGVEDATPDVHDAFAAMVTPPDVPASALDAQDTPWGVGASSSGAQVSDSGPSGDAKRGGSSILEGATLNFYGVKDAETARDMFEEMLTRVLEGDAAQIAGEGAPA